MKVLLHKILKEGEIKNIKEKIEASFSLIEKLRRNKWPSHTEYLANKRAFLSQ
jgi:hypothetical protein